MGNKNSRLYEYENLSTLSQLREGSITDSFIIFVNKFSSLTITRIGEGLLIFSCLFWSIPCWAGYLQLDAVADVKTRFSSGCSTIQELANLARHRGIDIVIFSDNDRRSLEYGIVPFERIFKKKITQPSILDFGVASYLAEINSNNQKFDDVMLIPAVESAPFYYWSGSLAERNLTANNWGKHLMIIGLDRPEDFEQLPILNSNFSSKYFDLFFESAVLHSGIFLIFFIFYVKRWARKTIFCLMILSLLLAINNHPFKSSRFDAYRGDPAIEPYQALIDYVRSKNAMIFWNHLESTQEIGRDGAMSFKTLPHPEDLILSRGYTGFQAVYDGKSQATEPGKHWDQVLMDYISGNRKQPAWGYGGNDFNCEGDKGHVFGGVRTVLLVREKKTKAVFEAFHNGRMYSVKQSGDHRMSLDDFSINDTVTQKAVTLGESLIATNYPEIKIKIRSTQGSEKPFTLSIIRNGELIKKEEATLPYELNWRDEKVKQEGRVYYRMMAKIDDGDYLVSNPIFVDFKKVAKEVASLPSMSGGLFMSPKVPRVQFPVNPVFPEAPVEPDVKMKDTKPILQHLVTKSKNELKKSLEAKKSMIKMTPESLSISKEHKLEASMNFLGLEKSNSNEGGVIQEPIPPKIKEPISPSEVQLTNSKNVELPTVENTKAIEARDVVKKKGRVFLMGKKQDAEPAPTAASNERLAKIESMPKKSLKKTKISPELTKNKNIPKISSKSELVTKRYVVALIDGLTLKKGPGIEFPEIAKAKKGERLKFVRSLNATFSNKPWLEVQRKGRTVYVWGGLVQPE